MGGMGLFFQVQRVPEMTSNTVRFEPKTLTSYTDNDIVDEIKRVVGTFDGEIPNSTQFKRISRVSLQSISRRFGSYAEALKKAGFTYTKRSYSVSRRKYTREQILSNLQEVLRRADGYAFSLKFYTENGGLNISRKTITKTLGLSWKDALAKVGAINRARVVQVSVHSQRLKYLAELTPDDLLNELDLVWQRIGHCPTRNEFKRSSKKFTTSIYTYRFGSWGKAIKSLCESKNIPIPRIPGTVLPITQEDLICEIQSVQRNHPDARITYELYKSDGGIYHIDTFRNRFVTWARAVEAAGCVPGGHGSIEFTDDELFDEMQRVWEHFGRQPSFGEMEMEGKYSPNTYHRRFGSWRKAIHVFCADRNSDDGVPSAISDSPSPDEGNSELEPKEIADCVPTAEPSPIIIIRETGRSVPPRLRFRVFQRDNFTCKFCGRSPSSHAITIEADHITPYSYPHNGETVMENLQTLCRDCNKGKSNLLAL